MAREDGITDACNHIVQQVAVLVSSRADDENGSVDPVACDAFIDHVERLSQSSTVALSDAFCSERVEKFLQRGICHADPNVASTSRRLIIVLLRASPAAVTRLLRAPRSTRGKRPRAKLSSTSPPLLHDAMSAPSEVSSALACVRHSALQVARAALEVENSPDVVAAVARALPRSVLMTLLSDPVALVARSARELLCTILEHHAEAWPGLEHGLRNWWHGRLPPVASARAVTDVPRPHYLLERPHPEVNESNADAPIGSHTHTSVIDDPEAAIALAATLVEHALSACAPSVVCEQVLRDGEVLSRCTALLAAALGREAPFAPPVAHRLLALVTRVCEGDRTALVGYLLPPLQRPHADDGDVMWGVLSSMTAEADALLSVGDGVGAMRLAGSCRPVLHAASTPRQPPPPPVALVVRVAGACLDAANWHDLDVDGRRRTLLHAMWAARTWSATSWAQSLQSLGWPTLIIRLIDRLAGGCTALPPVPPSHTADEARLLREAAASLAAMLTTSSMSDMPLAEATRAMGSLCAALAFCVGTDNMPLEGIGVRRLGSGVPRALLEALVEIVHSHPKLLTRCTPSGGDGDAHPLTHSLRAAASSREADVRGAACDAIGALIDRVDGAVTFAMHAQLISLIASLLAQAEDEATRAAAFRAAARLISEPAACAALHILHPMWMIELWRTLREDEPSADVTTAALGALTAAVRAPHLCPAAIDALRAVLAEPPHEPEEPDGTWCYADAASTVPLLSLPEGMEALCAAASSSVAIAAVELVAALQEPHVSDSAASVPDLHEALHLTACIQKATQHYDPHVRRVAARVLPEGDAELSWPLYQKQDVITQKICFFGACAAARSHECE